MHQKLKQCVQSRGKEAVLKVCAILAFQHCVWCVSAFYYFPSRSTLLGREQAAITEPFFRAAESGRFQKRQQQQQQQLHHCGALLPCAKQKCACVCVVVGENVFSSLASQKRWQQQLMICLYTTSAKQLFSSSSLWNNGAQEGPERINGSCCCCCCPHFSLPILDTAPEGAGEGRHRGFTEK